MQLLHKLKEIIVRTEEEKMKGDIKKHAKEAINKNK